MRKALFCASLLVFGLGMNLAKADHTIINDTPYNYTIKVKKTGFDYERTVKGYSTYTFKTAGVDAFEVYRRDQKIHTIETKFFKSGENFVIFEVPYIKSNAVADKNIKSWQERLALKRAALERAALESAKKAGQEILESAKKAGQEIKEAVIEEEIAELIEPEISKEEVIEVAVEPTPEA